MGKINVAYYNGEVEVNGKRTTPHWDGNNGRSVYICDEYVVKFDDHGYEHDDMTIWKSIQREDRKYFVPTLAEGETDAGTRWSVQPYVELTPIEYVDDDVLDAARSIVIDLVDKYGLQDLDYYREETPRNWGIHEGQPIIFDYGL